MTSVFEGRLVEYHLNAGLYVLIKKQNTFTNKKIFYNNKCIALYLNYWLSRFGHSFRLQLRFLAKVINISLKKQKLSFGCLNFGGVYEFRWD